MAFSLLNQQMLISAVNISSFLSPTRPKISTSYTSSVSNRSFPSKVPNHIVKGISCNAASDSSDQNPTRNPKPERRRKTSRQTPKDPKNEGKKDPEGSYPGIIPKRPRRGRRSEAAAVEDYIRGSLEQTLESIRKQNPEVVENMQKFMKEKAASDDDTSDDEEGVDGGEKEMDQMVVEEEDPDWPLDTEVGWGIRASEYFDQHSIKNVVGEDGTEIDWEGEIDYGLVKEINCLEWESFAFHPSPLIVLVFERYNRQATIFGGVYY